ncbi:hypothetical protein GBA52_011501 [Prunus armeniaca]|nr:hypothetical protein GBA52_011501 [Prunus armeniaca]
MCRYQDWEDDLPDSEVHDEYPGRDAVTAFIRQIEQQMNEISGFLDNMKEKHKNNDREKPAKKHTIHLEEQIEANNVWRIPKEAQPANSTQFT